MSIRLTTGALHVKNGGSYDTLDVFRGYSDVDDELDSLSENPVQNKVIKSALDGISASVPTDTSDLTNNAGFQNATQVQALIDATIQSLDATNTQY